MPLSEKTGNAVLSQQQISDFKAVGYFVARGFFSEAELEPVIRDLDAIVDREMKKAKEEPKGPQSSWISQGFAFCAQLHKENDRLRKFVAHPKMARAAHDLLGTDIRLYWDQAVYKHPKVGQSFPWHQDSGYGYPTPPEYVTCWVALDDTDAENGGVWALPGSHKQGIFPHTDDGEGHLVGYQGTEKGECVALKKVDVLVFSALILHSTGPNHTDRKRRAYVLQYCDSVTIRKGDSAEDYLRKMPMVFQDGKPVEVASES